MLKYKINGRAHNNYNWCRNPTSDDEVKYGSIAIWGYYIPQPPGYVGAYIRTELDIINVMLEEQVETFV